MSAENLIGCMLPSIKQKEMPEFCVMQSQSSRVSTNYDERSIKSSKGAFFGIPAASEGESSQPTFSPQLSKSYPTQYPVMPSSLWIEKCRQKSVTICVVSSSWLGATSPVSTAHCGIWPYLRSSFKSFSQPFLKVFYMQSILKSFSSLEIK